MAQPIFMAKICYRGYLIGSEKNSRSHSVHEKGLKKIVYIFK